MTTPQQADADPVAVVLAWLQNHPEAERLLGGPGHVSGVEEAPWPRLIVDGGVGGDLRTFTWDAEHEVTLTLVGDPTGAPGKAAMWSIALRILRLVADLPDQQEVDEYSPVVSKVRPSGVAVYQPRQNGQPAYNFGVFVTLRPPLLLPESDPAP